MSSSETMKLPDDWGCVDSGTLVRDANGAVFQVDNQHGWVVLQSQGRSVLTFEALDPIDGGFTMVKPPPPPKRTRRSIRNKP